MKILYVITGLGKGGAERVVCDLADKMYEKGNIVKIAYLTGDILTRPVNEKIELIKLNLNSISTFLFAYVSLSRLIKDYNPDIVHAHMVHANIITRLIKILSPVKKLINTAHNSNEGGIIRMLLYRATHHLADVTTNVSNTAVSAFEAKNAVPKNGMRTVYNGVNFNNFKYQPEARKKIVAELGLNEEKIILAVGRFNIQKNYPNLLRAIKYLKENNALDFILLIAGDGELKSTLEKIILEFDLSDDVKLLGIRNDISTLMSACDVFVLSSDYEGLPTVLIEALACQSHVVSTDVSGAREIISDYGKIVPINEYKTLAEQIFISLQCEDRNKLAGSYIKNNFDIDIIYNQWIDIYKSK
ncbi:glycosyltransferase [Psychrobacter sp. 16-MNA-CIBAN-0192]|uniref:glycosyltransferase n=1 Tax=Psychrobacter sp. 16-MNA-CIBAN-0192 TaxID=3140448 RepID=UPI003326A38E